MLDEFAVAAGESSDSDYFVVMKKNLDKFFLFNHLSHLFFSLSRFSLATSLLISLIRLSLTIPFSIYPRSVGLNKVSLL
jgi:hypothetical protein